MMIMKLVTPSNEEVEEKISSLCSSTFTVLVLHDYKTDKFDWLEAKLITAHWLFLGHLNIS